MWKLSVFYFETGKRNRESGLQCQDYIKYVDKENFQAITLADGTGENDLARLGAESSCTVLAKILTEYFEDLYEMETSQVQFNIITNIQRELYGLCKEHQTDLKSFQSTLLGVVIDNRTNRFIAVHLGDGSIGIKRNGVAATISYPENGRNKKQTYLTSQHRIRDHIKVIRGDVKDIQEFILISDGWDEKRTAGEQFEQMEMSLKEESGTYVDDVSHIALKRD